MQKIIFVFSFLLIANFSFAQVNLVPNPSFEDTVNCPIAPDEMYNSSGWSSYGASPDYMNACCSSAMGVPYNWGGYQQAASGNAYAAFATYVSSIANYREFIGRPLSSSLNVGTKYYVTFKVSLSISPSAAGNCASDKMGAMFSTVPYNLSPAPITNNPPVYSNSIITDSLNWTRIFGFFIPDSAYNHIIIGNFFDDNNTDTLKITTGFFDFAYYFLDDVCVSIDSLYTLNYDYTYLTEYNSIADFSIYPNPAKDYFVIDNKNKSYDLKIYNSLGQELYYEKGISEKHYEMDLENINEGLLFISIISENCNFNYKLLKQ